MAFNVYLYDFEEEEDEDDFPIEHIDQVFHPSHTYQEIFDAVIDVPVEVNSCYLVNTPVNNQTDVTEIFFQTVMEKYQSFKQRAANVKISFISIIDEHDSITDRLNSRQITNLSDASILKCDNVNETLMAFAKTAKMTHTANNKIDVMTFYFKNDVRIYFVHCRINTDLEEWDRPWKKIAADIIEVEDASSNLQCYSFIVPNKLKVQAVQNKLFYSPSIDEVQSPDGNRTKDKVKIEMNELETNLTQIRADLNLISTFLVNNSARMAQELDYSMKLDGEENMDDIAGELEMLQGKLAMLVEQQHAEDELHGGMKADDKNKIEWFFNGDNFTTGPIEMKTSPPVVSTSPEVATSRNDFKESETSTIDAPVVNKSKSYLGPSTNRLALQIRPLNKIEKSRRSRNSMTISDDSKNVKIEDAVEGEWSFSYNAGAYMTALELNKDTVQVCKPMCNELMPAGRGSVWILGSQNSGSECVLHGADYNSLTSSLGNTKRPPAASLLGVYLDKLDDRKSVEVSYLCLSGENKVIDILTMNSGPVSLYQTPDGLKHNGKRMRVTASEVWKLVLFGHGILDVTLDNQKKACATLLLQIEPAAAAKVAFIKLGLEHTHPLLANLTNKTSGGIGGVLRSFLASHVDSVNTCVCGSPSSYGLAETVYWLNLAAMFECSLPYMDYVRNGDEELLVTSTTQDANTPAHVTTPPPITLSIQSSAVSNLQHENLVLIQKDHKLQHDLQLFKYRHKHTLKALHTCLNLYHTLSSNITHYASRDLVSIVQRTPGAQGCVDLLALGSLQGFISNMGLDLEDDGAINRHRSPVAASYSATSINKRSGKRESEADRLKVHDISIPSVNITTESLAKSGMAMVESSGSNENNGVINEDNNDDDDIMKYVGDMNTKPKTELEKLARQHIELQLKYKDLERSNANLVSQDGKDLRRRRLTQEVVELRKERDHQANDIKSLLLQLMELKTSHKLMHSKLLDQQIHLQNMEAQYLHLQNIYTKVVTDQHENEEKYQADVTYLVKLLNSLTLGGNYCNIDGKDSMAGGNVFDASNNKSHETKTGVDDIGAVGKEADRG